MAANAPQYDWRYLYALERQKLFCRRTCFSHSHIDHFDSVWAGFRCKNCGRKEYCPAPVIK